jgi:hypothetical protein
MLGATQYVDMISSLRRNYGRVEVAVLNVDLLPSSIDTVVIGDRLFSLPIQVEGPEGHEVHNNQMEIDEGNSGADNSREGQREEGRDTGPWGNNANNGNSNNESQDSKQSEALQDVDHVQAECNLGDGNHEEDKQYSSLKENKQKEAVHASHAYVDATKFSQVEGNTLTKMAFQINEGISVQGAVGYDLDSTEDDMHETIPMAKISHTELQHGNSIMNLNRSLNESKNDEYKFDSIVHNQLHAALGSQTSASLVPTHLTENGTNKGTEGGDLGGMITLGVTPLKRSKRCGGSADEDSSARAERLKAKRNLDGPGMLTSKSFLAFSDSKVEKNISLLGVLLGKNVRNSIACLKKIEHDRLLEAASREPNQVEADISHDGEVSDIGSDLGLDQIAIKHLMGDNAEDIVGTEETQWSDFKPVMSKSKSGSSQRGRGRKKVHIQLQHS